MSDIIAQKNDDLELGRVGKVSTAVGSLGQIQAMDVLPPLLGGTVAIGTTLLVRKFGKTKPRLVEYAPLIGAGAGVLGSVPLYWWRGKKAVISGAVTGAVAGVGLFAFERVSATSWMTSGLGRHVVKTNRRLPGTGAMHVVESSRGSARSVPTAQSPGSFDLDGFGVGV